MTLGIMQPYFFPYLGYFSLIKQCDYWISYDTVQYIMKGWVNRNRILHPNRLESMYIFIPLKKHHHKTNINEILIDNNQPYTERIIGQLTASYKKRAPYFSRVIRIVEDCLSAEQINLSKLNEICIKRVCNYLGINTDIKVHSEMNLGEGALQKPDDFTIMISKALKCDRYINAIGGVHLFENCKFEAANIDLKFLRQLFIPYEQGNQVFLEGLSIIDVMMFNGPEQIRWMMNNYQLIRSDKFE